MAFAALTIDLDARLAKFEEGMKRATSTVENSAKSMEAKFSGVANGIKAMTALVGVGAFVALAAEIKNVATEMITSAAALDDFSEKTGASVEKLSELQQVAKIGGQDFASVTDLLVKMTRALSGAGSEDETKAIGAGLQAIGLQAEELRRLDPADALKRIAVALNGYNDSQNKTAIASAILGKSAAEYLPYLKDLASTSGITAKVTAEQAAQAEALEKALNRLSLESYNAKQSMLLGLVPALNNAIAQFNVAKEAAGGLAGALLLLARVSNADPGGQLNKINASLGKLRETQEALENPKGAAQGLKKFLNTEDAAIVRLQIADLEQKRELLQEVQRQQNASRSSALFGDVQGGVVKNDLPTFRIPASGKGEGGAKTREIENVIKSLEKESLKVDALGKEYEVLLGIELGLYGKVTEEEKKRAVSLGRLIDLSKEASDEEKRRGEEITKWADEQVRAAKEAETLAQRWRDLADPTQEQNRRLQEGLDLLKQQRITIQEFNAGANPRLTSLLNPEKSDRDVLNEALKEGDISLEKYLEAIKRLNGELDKTKDTSNEIFEKLSSAFEDAVINGKKFSDVLKGIGQDLLKIFIRDQITKPAGDFFKDIFKSDQPEQLGGPGFGSGGGGSGGLIMEAFNIAKGLFGFANGGEFRVGGSGGTDSQLVAFKASPNETVTVRTPAQQRQDGAGGFSLVQNIDLRGNNDRSWVAAQLERTKQETILAVADMTRRGGNYARAVRG